MRIIDKLIPWVLQPRWLWCLTRLCRIPIQRQRLGTKEFGRCSWGTIENGFGRMHPRCSNFLMVFVGSLEDNIALTCVSMNETSAEECVTQDIDILQSGVHVDGSELEIRVLRFGAHRYILSCGLAVIAVPWPWYLLLCFGVASWQLYLLAAWGHCRI